MTAPPRPGLAGVPCGTRCGPGLPQLSPRGRSRARPLAASCRFGPARSPRDFSASGKLSAIGVQDVVYSQKLDPRVSFPVPPRSPYTTASWVTLKGDPLAEWNSCPGRPLYQRRLCPSAFGESIPPGCPLGPRVDVWMTVP